MDPPVTFLEVSDTDRVLLVMAAALLVAWFLVVAILRVVRQPRNPVASPATMELGTETPAVVNLLTRGFEVTPEAVPATLLDLAARGVVSLEQVGPGRYQLRLAARAATKPLRPYEARIVTLLNAKAVRGVVPTEALTTGPEQDSAHWFGGFRNEVIEEARTLGLSEDLWPGWLASVLALAGLVPVALVVIAVGTVGVAGLLLVVPVVARMRSGRRQRHTGEGLAAGSRWMGVRAQLRQSDIFPTLPPTGVILWERYMGYGAAMGLAAEAVRAVPMGAESDTRAWSAYGGEWRQVEVAYPWRWPPGWGMHPAVGLLAGLVVTAIGGAIMWVLVRFGRWDPDVPIADLPDPAPWVLIGIQTVGALIAVRFLTWGVPVLVRAIPDLWSSDRVSGQVLRIRERGSEKRRRRYIAVDDGRSDRIRAWIVLPAIDPILQQGDVVTSRVSRHLRHVFSMETGSAPTGGVGQPDLGRNPTFS